MEIETKQRITFWCGMMLVFSQYIFLPFKKVIEMRAKSPFGWFGLVPMILGICLMLVSNRKKVKWKQK